MTLIVIGSKKKKPYTSLFKIMNIEFTPSAPQLKTLNRNVNVNLSYDLINTF